MSVWAKQTAKLSMRLCLNFGFVLCYAFSKKFANCIQIQAIL